MNIVQRFLISNATNQPLGETGDVEPVAPVFEVASRKNDLPMLFLGAVLGAMGVGAWYIFTDADRQLEQRRIVGAAYQSGRAHRRHFGSD